MTALGYDRAVPGLPSLLGLPPKFVAELSAAGAPHAPQACEELLSALGGRGPAAGRLLRLIGRREEALAAFEEAAGLTPLQLAWRGELRVQSAESQEAGRRDLFEAARAIPDDPRPWVWIAATLMEKAAGPEVLAALQEALRCRPRDLTARLLRAAAFERLGSFDEALEDLAQAAAADPDGPGPRALQARVAVRAGRRDLALEALNAAARLDPDCKDYFAFLLPDGPGTPKSRLDRFLRDHPKEAWVWALRGDLLRASGNEEAGIADLRKAAALAPETPWIRACLARSYVQGQKPGLGISQLRKAIALDPKCAWLHSWLGEAYRRERDFARSGHSFERCLRLNPRFAQAHVWLGRSYGDRGLWARAERCFSKAVELDGSYGFAYAKRGQARGELGRHCEAVLDFDRALKLELPCPREWILALRSKSRLAAGDHRGGFADLSEAIAKDLWLSWLPLDFRWKKAAAGASEAGLAATRKAVAKNPSAAWARLWRGIVKLGSGRAQESLRDLERARAGRAEAAWACGWQGRALTALGRPEEALDCLKEALAEDGARPWLWAWQAEALLEAGRPERALQGASRALELAPRSALALYVRSRAHAALGRRAEAIRDADLAWIVRNAESDTPWLREWRVRLLAG